MASSLNEDWHDAAALDMPIPKQETLASDTVPVQSSASWLGGQRFLTGTACMSRSVSSLAPGAPRAGHAAERRLYAYAAVYLVGMVLVLIEPLWGLAPNAYSVSTMGCLCGLTFYANPRNRVVVCV